MKRSALKSRKVEETETKLKQTRSKIPNNLDAIESDQSREILSHIVPLIPTHNPFQVLEPTILQTNSLDTDNLDPTSLETSTILEPAHCHLGHQQRRDKQHAAPHQLRLLQPHQLRPWAASSVLWMDIFKKFLFSALEMWDLWENNPPEPYFWTAFTQEQSQRWKQILRKNLKNRVVTYFIDL